MGKLVKWIRWGVRRIRYPSVPLIIAPSRLSNYSAFCTIPILIAWVLFTLAPENLHAHTHNLDENLPQMFLPDSSQPSLGFILNPRKRHMLVEGGRVIAVEVQHVQLWFQTLHESYAYGQLFADMFAKGSFVLI